MENSTEPIDVVASLRALAHDLSNSLETVLHAAYLLQEAKLDGKHKDDNDDNDKDKRWAAMIYSAAHDAARINREIRKILNSQS